MPALETTISLSPLLWGMPTSAKIFSFALPQLPRLLGRTEFLFLYTDVNLIRLPCLNKVFLPFFLLPSQVTHCTQTPTHDPNRALFSWTLVLSTRLRVFWPKLQNVDKNSKGMWKIMSQELCQKPWCDSEKHNNFGGIWDWNILCPSAFYSCFLSMQPPFCISQSQCSYQLSCTTRKPVFANIWSWFCIRP